MSSRWLWACPCLLVAACGGTSTDESVTYVVNTSVNNYYGRPASDDPPLVYIDGVQTDAREETFADTAALDAAPRLVELRYHDAVVATLYRDPVPDCGSNGPLVTWRKNVVVYANGYLDEELDDIECATSEPNAGVTGGYNPAEGYDCSDACGSGEQCSLRASLVEPLFSTAQCAPIGPRQLDEPCSWIADPGGAYSDCGEGLLCAYGTCHARCAVPDFISLVSPTACACEYVPGMPGAVTVCPGIGDADVVR
jgi:hypothetical protein